MTSNEYFKIFHPRSGRATFSHFSMYQVLTISIAKKNHFYVSFLGVFFVFTF